MGRARAPLLKFTLSMCMPPEIACNIGHGSPTKGVCDVIMLSNSGDVGGLGHALCVAHMSNTCLTPVQPNRHCHCLSRGRTRQVRYLIGSVRDIGMRGTDAQRQPSLMHACVGTHSWSVLSHVHLRPPTRSEYHRKQDLVWLEQVKDAATTRAGCIWRGR